MQHADWDLLFTHSVILGSMLPIHKRFPSWATLSEMMEAFSTVSAADDMCTLREAGKEDRQIRFNEKVSVSQHFFCICVSMEPAGLCWAQCPVPSWRMCHTEKLKLYLSKCCGLCDWSEGKWKKKRTDPDWPAVHSTTQRHSTVRPYWDS